MGVTALDSPRRTGAAARGIPQQIKLDERLADRAGVAAVPLHKPRNNPLTQVTPHRALTVLGRQSMAGSTNQAFGSRASVRFALGTWTRRWSFLTLTYALSGSCSLMVDVSEKQCSADSDCMARGLANTSCVANLCRANTSSPSTAGAQGVATVAGSGGKGSGAAGKAGSESVDSGPSDVVMDGGDSGAGGAAGVRSVGASGPPREI